MSGSNELLTLTVSRSGALVIQILLVSGLAHKQGPLPISYVHECSRVSITIRPGSIGPTWQKQTDSTQPQAISQERNREVQTILNALKASSNSELARKRKVSSNQGANQRGKNPNQLTTSPKFLHSKELKSSRGKTLEHVRMESFVKLARKC